MKQNQNLLILSFLTETIDVPSGWWKVDYSGGSKIKYEKFLWDPLLYLRHLTDFCALFVASRKCSIRYILFVTFRQERSQSRDAHCMLLMHKWKATIGFNVHGVKLPSWLNTEYFLTASTVQYKSYKKRKCNLRSRHSGLRQSKKSSTFRSNNDNIILRIRSKTRNNVNCIQRIGSIVTQRMYVMHCFGIFNYEDRNLLKFLDWRC